MVVMIGMGVVLIVGRGKDNVFDMLSILDANFITNFRLPRKTVFG
jgi:hypothetical protein